MAKKPLLPEQNNPDPTAHQQPAASLETSPAAARRERARLAAAAYRARKRAAAPPPPVAYRKRRKRRQQPAVNPQALARLTDAFIYDVKKKGTYADGGNLYLQVGIGGSAKSWMFIYSRGPLLAESSHPALIMALEAARHPVPPLSSRQRGSELFKIANAIAKEYANSVEAHQRAVKAYEHATEAAQQGLLYVPVPEPGAPPHKSALIAVAEQYVEDKRKAYLGLGSLDDVPPKKARDKAKECRDMLAENPPRDPGIEFKRRKSEAAKLNARTKVFHQIALDYLDFRMAEPEEPMRISTYRGHRGALNKYLTSLHDLYPRQITATEVFNIIQPLRIKGRRSTAHNCRTFIYRVIEWSKGQGAFPKEEWNPATLDIGAPLRLLMKTATTDPKRFSQPLKSLHFTKVPALFKQLQDIKLRKRYVLAEASRAVNKARATVYNNIRSGRLKAIKPDKPYSSRSMDHWEVEPEELFSVWPQVREVIPGLPSVALYALMFQILTASRPVESLGARWEEWLEEIAVWRVPWQRTKGGGRERQDLYIPLSREATAILKLLREQQQREGIKTQFIFGSYWTATLTSARIGIPPARSTLRSLLEKNVDEADIDKTLHGFRTSFSSWANRLRYLEKDIERALKHKRGFGETHVSRLYGRDAYNDEGGDPEVLAAFDDDPLRGLFEDWAIYCVTGELPEGRQLRKPASVVPLSRAQTKTNRRRV
jgi:integrase